MPSLSPVMAERNRLKKANTPIVSQNGPSVTMQGLQLSLQSVTPKHLPLVLWWAGAEPAGRPWEAAWEQGPAPAGHPCPSHLVHPGIFSLTPTTCPVHGPSALLPITARRSGSLPWGEQHPSPRPPQLLRGRPTHTYFPHQLHLYFPKGQATGTDCSLAGSSGTATPPQQRLLPSTAPSHPSR